MNAHRKSIWLDWDYVLIFDWGPDVEGCKLREVTEELPAGLVDRAKRWGAAMDEEYGILDIDESPKSPESEREKLEAEYQDIRKAIESLGYSLYR